jgi:hypothetical protein
MKTAILYATFAASFGYAAPTGKWVSRFSGLAMLICVVVTTNLPET